MGSLTGLYIAYEIAKGVSALAGAHQPVVDAAGSVFNIAKILQERARKNGAEKKRDPPAEKGTHHVDVNDAALREQMDQVTSLLALLGNSQVRLDLRALRDSWRGLEIPMRFGDLLFIPPEQQTPTALKLIPRLATFEGLAHARVSWLDEARRVQISQFNDRNPTRGPRQSPKVLIDSDTTETQVWIRPDGSERLMFVYCNAARSQLMPISWGKSAPCLRVFHLAERESCKKQTLLSELVVTLPTRRRKSAPK